MSVLVSGVELVVDANALSTDTSISAHLEGDDTTLAAGKVLFVTVGGDEVTDSFEVIRVDSLVAGTATVTREMSGVAVALTSGDRLPARVCAEVLTGATWPADPDSVPSRSGSAVTSLPLDVYPPWEGQAGEPLVHAIYNGVESDLTNVPGVEGDILLLLP